jgi:uncharacterized membrane protein YoaK (UPF0700 family)
MPIPDSPVDDAETLAQWDRRIPTLLSVIAGLVDVTGFFTLGNIFTAHVTGNLVLVSASLVRRAPLQLAQLLAIPVFVLALAALWLVAWSSRTRGLRLARLFLWLQFLLVSALLVFSVITKPSASPRGLAAGIAVMIAISAIACQYALFRLAIPEAASTASMTGNLTNATLALVDGFARRRPLMAEDTERLKKSLHLLVGFLAGCLVAAAAVSALLDWAWALPAVLAGVAVALGHVAEA